MAEREPNSCDSVVQVGVRPPEVPSDRAGREVLGNSAGPVAGQWPSARKRATAGGDGGWVGVIRTGSAADRHRFEFPCDGRVVLVDVGRVHHPEQPVGQG